MSLIQDSHIRFVNLDVRTDRLKRMEKTLADVGIEAKRVRGMLPSEYKGDPKFVETMRRRTPGAIGCYFGQLSIICEALRQNKHAFVMEDDLVFCSDFHKRLELMEKFAETHEWDVFWLGGTFHINPPYWHKNTLKRDAEVTDNPRMIRTYGAFSTHAYIVNRNSIRKILIMLDAELESTIGIDYSFIQIQPRLHTYAFVPGCVIQYDNQSNIGRGETKFSGFAKLGPYWFQDRMEQFDPTTFDWKEAAK